MSNVTQEACHLFLTFCEECHKKRARKLPKSLVVKPLVSTNVKSRDQMTIPLKSKRAKEVASKLLKIFFMFSCSGILQSNNGQIFSNAITTELKICWPELKLVAGRPRHPQSQGAVERLNGILQDKLSIWMRENECKRYVHETTGQSPFKEPPIGLKSYVLPKSLEEDNEEESLNRDGKNYEENESNIMKHFPETFMKARKGAAAGQSRAAAKMTRQSMIMLKSLHIDQNATLKVLDVDVDLRN
ncbi:KRAB-A domain-containing protein 2 [Trichinella zimbabwensis]|uniref:KRAB-A domain-containing protein 2 n=1 Tax=Trichinella zimbabwensis TaxID=268475 RepID=A0A0V1GWQ2_9BILA|nr:KRAB-A domain-containing protein 2 [Trichinella zimbabwensis]